MTDRRRFSGIVSAICFTLVAVILLGVSALARAAGEDTTSTTSVEVSHTDTVFVDGVSEEAKADYRQLMYELALRANGANVRDEASWEALADDWYRIAQIGYGILGTDTLALGQVVPVPIHPADWDYVDWEDIPIPSRPAVMLAHACEVMTGRVDQITGELSWAPHEALQRFEAANIAARLIELQLEVLLEGAAYSRPGCPLAMEIYRGDPDMFTSLIERLEARHTSVVDEVKDIRVELYAIRDQLTAEMFAMADQAAANRIMYQSGFADIWDRFLVRVDELKNVDGALWVAMAETAKEIAELRQEMFEIAADAVEAYCAKSGCEGPQGVQGPRGLQGPVGPQGPAGQDADVDGLRNEFNDMLADMRGDFVTRSEFEQDQARQDAVLDDHEGRITNLENQGYIYADYCPLTVSFTGPNNESYNEHYPGGEVSANISVDALAAALGGVITTYGLPEGGLVPEGSDMTFRKSAWYESLRRGAEITATMVDGRGATCSRSVTLGGY